MAAANPWILPLSRRFPSLALDQNCRRIKVQLTLSGANQPSKMNFSEQFTGRSEPGRKANRASNNNTNSTTNTATTTNDSNKPACDRCKGQKLRCIWEHGSNTCRRCTRARAICQQPRPRPFGRPRCSTKTKNDIAQNQAHTRIWVPSASNDGTTQPQENGAEMPMAMSDDQDPTSFLSSTAVDLPRYLGLASLPTDPSLQIAISPPHGVHGTSFNWETSLLGDFSDAQLKNPATFYQPQGVINAVHPATSTPVSASAPVSADGASLFEFDPDDISGDREYSHGHWLKQLGDLNVAIYRHPLHPKPASGNMPGVSASFSTQPVSLSSLQIGQLLHMTSQLGRLTKEIDPADHLQPTYEGSAESDSFGEIKLAMHDRSTLFVVLGCYVRLEQTFTQALATVVEIRRSGPLSDDTYQLMPRLTVDGCSLEFCQTMQIDFVIYICEKTLVQIRRSITSLHADM